MISFTLGGAPTVVDVPPMTSLATVLRDHLGLTGTKQPCTEGFCGACTVHVDGVPVAACLVPAAQVEGRSVTTIATLDEPAVRKALAGNICRCTGYQAIVEAVLDAADAREQEPSR